MGVVFLLLGIWRFRESLAKVYDNFGDGVIKIENIATSSVVFFDQKPVAEEKPITLLFVGDMMLSRGVGNKMIKYNDYAFPFRKTAEFLGSADLTIGNLEGPISDKGADMKSKFSFRADPKVLEGINLAGFDILDINNNHIMDWGIEAFKDTLARLSDSGISYSGAGMNYDEANSPIIKEVDGTKIAFLSYRDFPSEHVQASANWPGISTLDVDRIINEVRAIKENKTADIVVIMFHWGEEYQQESNIRQQDIAHRLIDGGVDLIVGHHPHVAQEMEEYGGGHIAYSLGNFIFDQYFSKETMRGLVLRATIKAKKIEAVDLIESLMSTDYQPFIPSVVYPQAT